MAKNLVKRGVSRRPSPKALRPSPSDGPPCGRQAPSPQFRSRPRIELLRTRLSDYLEREGLKRSDQRWTIALVILESDRHLSAQEAVQAVQEAHPGIGAATVYRNLKILQDAGVIRETLADSQGRGVYEAYDDEHHDHVVCLDCGHIFEFHSEKIESLQTRVLEEMSFSEVRHRHVVYAHCQNKGGRRGERPS